MRYKEKKFSFKKQATLIERDIENVEKLFPVIEKGVTRIVKKVNNLSKIILRLLGEKVKDDIIDVKDIF